MLTSAFDLGGLQRRTFLLASDIHCTLRTWQALSPLISTVWEVWTVGPTFRWRNRGLRRYCNTLKWVKDLGFQLRSNDFKAICMFSWAIRKFPWENEVQRAPFWEDWDSYKSGAIGLLPFPSPAPPPPLPSLSLLLWDNKVSCHLRGMKCMPGFGVRRFQ